MKKGNEEGGGAERGEEEERRESLRSLSGASRLAEQASRCFSAMNRCQTDSFSCPVRREGGSRG
eukprot:27612-Pyramimonas_sp.AAC.1